ncbi:MAG: hypothetical protein HQ509_08255 [Candidatus Marinimicrobia bacterium]|nr:hypothetical protein [Candidatus Neomarinimicrobiota bacterium]
MAYQLFISDDYSVTYKAILSMKEWAHRLSYTFTKKSAEINNNVKIIVHLGHTFTIKSSRVRWSITQRSSRPIGPHFILAFII